MRKLAIVCIAIMAVALLAGMTCESGFSITGSLATGEVNIAYSQTLRASGGSGTYTSWSITSGALPPGLSLASSSGVISGIPIASGKATTAETYGFTVQVTDSRGATATRALSIIIVTAPSIATVSLPDGEVNVVYSQSLQASGGSGTYSSWTITAGILPNGLSLASSSGVISGTPTTAGTSGFTVQVIDSLGGSGSENLSITVAAAPSITTSSLANGEVNIAYSQTLQASAGSGSYTAWSVISGTLPDKLSLHSSIGVISGTPSTAGTFNFTVQVTDSNGSTATQALSITIVMAPSIATTSLPSGQQNMAYSQTLQASGGSGTYISWSVKSGSLPDGLSLNSSSGVISGTPTKAGTSNFTIMVTDSLGGTATQALSITAV